MDDDNATFGAGAKLALGVGLVVLLGLIAARAKGKEDEDDPPPARAFDARDFVRHKTAQLIDEGYPPAQAYAIANRIAGTSVHG